MLRWCRGSFRRCWYCWSLLFVWLIVGEVLEFLHRLGDVFKEYFNDATEEMIKNNFVTVVQVC